ncbi:MAG: ribose-5-phosphate isomerase RpiA [Candidatus Marsarchaeota archaeon]|nr:ribose-5-phosphate isomerase RpiA [Candidatus Marsarchaeota archaeon]
MANPSPNSPPWAETAKFAAAKEALKFVPASMSIGLGSGTTADIFISLLGEHAKKNNLSLKCAATSKKSAELARAQGLVVADLDAVSPVDLAVDGADEVDGRRRLIKGYGGASTREKIVDYPARRLLIIADMGKKSRKLDKAVPVEFLPFAKKRVEDGLKGLGAKSVELRKNADNTPFVTDNGFWLFHADFGEIPKPAKLEDAINSIEGVLENGLFAKRPADMVIFGKRDGSVKILGE